jgi:hypothetical protein
LKKEKVIKNKIKLKEFNKRGHTQSHPWIVQLVHRSRFGGLWTLIVWPLFIRLYSPREINYSHRIFSFLFLVLFISFVSLFPAYPANNKKNARHFVPVAFQQVPPTFASPPTPPKHLTGIKKKKKCRTKTFDFVEVKCQCVCVCVRINCMGACVFLSILGSFFFPSQVFCLFIFSFLQIMSL